MAPTEDPDVPEGGEAQALHDLVQSDGWQRFLAHVNTAWGSDAQLARIDRAFQELTPGDDEAERMTGLQIRAAAKSIHALTRWPHERLQQLTKKPARGPFAGLRRITR